MLGQVEIGEEALGVLWFREHRRRGVLHLNLAHGEIGKGDMV